MPDREGVLSKITKRLKSRWAESASRPNLRFRPDPISESFVGLIDVIFGVIIAQGFVLYRDKIVAVEVSIGTASLMLAYVVILQSWVGYHKSVSTFPYNRTSWSRVRLVVDIAILLLYAYLLFVALELPRVLVGLAAVFILYAFAGIVRRIEWKDSKVSKPWLSVAIAAIFLVVWYASVTFPTYGVLWLALAFFFLFAYREIRQLLGYSRFVVGVDVDGVLGEQANPVLDRLRARGLARGLTKDDIDDWNFKINGTDIAKEIETALLDPQFVREMPVQPGSTDAMRTLYAKYHVVIATSRPAATSMETVEWLRKSFQFHEFANTRLVGKAHLGLDLLVDDNLDNVRNFASTGGIAILFSQPWNRKEDAESKVLIASRKLIRCNGWQEVVQHIEGVQR